MPGEAAIQEALLDIAGNLLGAKEAHLELRVIDGGRVGTAGHVDREPGLFEKGEGGLLEAA